MVSEKIRNILNENILNTLKYDNKENLNYYESSNKNQNYDIFYTYFTWYFKVNR